MHAKIWNLKVMWKLFWGKGLPTKGLISSHDNCWRFSPSQTSDKPQAGYEPAQNLSSGFAEWGYAVVITTTSSSLQHFTATKILKLVILFLVRFFNTYIFQFLQLRCQWRLFKSLFEKCIQEDSVYKEPFVLNEKWKPKWN